MPEVQRDVPINHLSRLMDEHRLLVAEVAKAAGVSMSSVKRARAAALGRLSVRPATLRRIADAVSDLAQFDPDETFRDLMSDAGAASAVRQADLGIRGAAELARQYQQMSPLGRHLLLEQARMLARELPAEG
ncbi:MAG TPA: helix-turn-helix transcriptional regulator [Chloroflexota bacterium]|jgi:predicted transcriptional regulator|nr:helix-turn-helix transcriptional regulator [Chloroflexota bacterium]